MVYGMRTETAINRKGMEREENCSFSLAVSHIPFGWNRMREKEKKKRTRRG
jgi:hypothetical protein